jgi:HEAT repeat protein
MSTELEFLLDQLADASRPARTLNLAPLSDLPRGAAPQLHTAFRVFGAPRRLELIAAMVEQAEADIHLNFQTVFRACLSDADAQVRRLAIEGLWEDERTSLIAPLVALLAADPASEVRAAAATSLGRFVLMGVLGEIAESQAAQAEQSLRTAWGRPGEVNEVRRRALEGLAYLNDAGIYASVDDAYYDEDELMRQSAVFAMGRTADRRWAKYVLAELGSVTAAMRFEAATAAGELGLNAAVRPLIRLLDDPDGNVREAAVLALGKIGGAEAKRGLEVCLQSSDARLAEAAGEAMEELTFNSGTLNDTLLEYSPADERAAADRLSDDEDDTDDEDDEEDFDEDFDDLLGDDYDDDVDFDFDADEEEDEDWDDELDDDEDGDWDEDAE